MMTSQFNSTMKRLKEADGKQYFEEYLQYCGWWFMQLTDRQHNKLVELFKEWGYETKYNPYNNLTYIYTPNGLGLTVTN